MASVQKPQSKTTPPLPLRSAWRRHGALLSLLGLASLLYGVGLGRTDLWAPDEPRYAAIAEEMRSFQHGASGLVLLHLNDVPYTQKPPLYFWLAAATGAPFGRVDEWAARLPSAIAGVLCIALTVGIGRMMYGRSMPAILAAGFLATSFRFALTARRVQLDIVLCLFELTAIAVFLLLETRRGGIENARRFPASIAGLHLSLGAAGLVKGPVGWLPLLVFAGYLAWEGRLAGFRAIAPWWSWCFSFGPVCVWILAAVAMAPSGFAESAIGENLFGRFFSGTSHARPFYYFAYQLPLDFLPWSLLLPFSLPILWRAANRSGEGRDAMQGRASRVRFLLVWIVVPLIFFSLSAGKRGVYLLPVFPALGLAAVAVWRPWDSDRALAPTAIRRWALAILVVAGLELAVFTLALPRLEGEKSARPIARAATALARDGEPIGVLGMSPIEGAIAYYGARPVISLRDESQLRPFLEQGGRIVLLRARHFETLGEELGLREHSSFRSGERRLVLAERFRSTPRRESP